MNKTTTLRNIILKYTQNGINFSDVTKTTVTFYIQFNDGSDSYMGHGHYKNGIFTPDYGICFDIDEEFLVYDHCLIHVYNEDCGECLKLKIWYCANESVGTLIDDED